ncbi:hypothetical protein [Actinomadura sp. DC4]|uniref:hypothetical protein n=1 Tax=Actinomadura sp. DC4 TaxID=3055069 RepID=UPI0025AF09B3|nr:hypothetical protein [Actinomadura sp. DC4]MDN3357663.1 hypothetical protein [Actinomadura sp. DC4]
MTTAEAEGVPRTETQDLYALLLGLAGRIPDEGLAEMRLCLADGELDELTSLLAAEIETGRLALTDQEAGTARADHAPRIGSPLPLPYRFGDEYGVTMPNGDGWESQKDAMDAVVVEAGERVGGLIGIWRVFRHAHEGPARRVYLAEARTGADLAEPTAEMQYALTEASEDTPRVEVFEEGTPLPAYHDAALGGATLVWAAEDTPVHLVRVFDGADAAGGPYFHDDHPRLGGPDGERVLAYLSGGEPILNTPGALDDVLDQGRLGAVPAGFRSDGRWVWPDAVAYYLKRHHLAPDPELVAHALAQKGPPGPLNRLTRHRVLTTLFAPTGGEPVWQAG